ncbi:hypothetical protein GCM10023321_35360 [Pseudonocardia eucalypti]|uniref:DUF2029 domain-containing protein n=1 Tax=Pseudonocardia eucalypti TaxID=648755 RepID=A0ABP9Q5S9_9PSEU|nr:hypothetical protein [Pseudonocardia eucalypti]
MTPLRRLPDVLGVALAGVAVLLAGWLFVRFGSGNLVRMATPDMHWHVDFDTFWRSAVALREGTDLYDTGARLPNLNPPLLSVLFTPLASVDVLSAYRAMVLLTLALVVGSVVAVAEEVGARAGVAMLAVAALLVSAPLHGTLALGQIYGLLTALLTAAWLAERRGRHGWSGVALGLLVAIKPSLLPLLAWPLLRRRWEALGASLAAGAAATLAGLVAGGWTATWEWLRLLAAKGADPFLDNDSLAGLAVRFGWPAWPGYLVASGLLAVTLVRVRRRPEYALWAVTAASLLLAPIAWNNYLVLLAPSVPLLLVHGRWSAALPVQALPMIGIEWSSLLDGGDSVPNRLGMSLYCGMLLVYWTVLANGRAGAAELGAAAPDTVEGCPSPSPDRSPQPVPSR